jgi:hypothetical protein
VLNTERGARMDQPRHAGANVMQQRSKSRRVLTSDHPLSRTHRTRHARHRTPAAFMTSFSSRTSGTPAAAVSGYSVGYSFLASGHFHTAVHPDYLALDTFPPVMALFACTSLPFFRLLVRQCLPGQAVYITEQGALHLPSRCRAWEWTPIPA